MPQASRQLVLVGGGHTHLHALKHARDYARRGVAVTLVSPEPYLDYSSTSARVLAGDVPASSFRIDVRGLVERAGGQYVRGWVHRVDVPGRRLMLEDRTVEWDVLSLAVGTEGLVPPELARDDRLYTPKPPGRMLGIRELLAERLDRVSLVEVVVVGAGPSGCELAGALDRLARRRKARDRLRLSVVELSAKPLPGLPARAADRVAGSFVRRSIELLVGQRVIAAHAGGLSLTGAEAVPADAIVWAAGERAPRMLVESSLPVDLAGSLLVNDSLQCVEDPCVFGGGDCIRILGRRPLPRLGSFALRQGRALHRSLLAYLDGRPFRPYRPPRRFLMVMNLGDGTGLAIWAGHCLAGRTVLWLKNLLDARFVRRYRL